MRPWIVLYALYLGLSGQAASGQAAGAHASGVQEPRFVVLPAQAASEVERQCSRTAPRVEGGWVPAPAQIAILESRLGDLAEARTNAYGRKFRLLNPSGGYRQYIGVVKGGRKYIYINGASAPNPGWREHLIVVCDGGDSFWGALYDPETTKFSELETNGQA